MGLHSSPRETDNFPTVNEDPKPDPHGANFLPGPLSLPPYEVVLSLGPSRSEEAPTPGAAPTLASSCSILEARLPAMHEDDPAPSPASPRPLASPPLRRASSPAPAF